MGLASAAGWAGAIFGTLTTIAQVIRIRRLGVDGVNATTWALFLLMSVYWLAYGLAVRSPQIIVSVLAAAPFLCWLLALLEPSASLRGVARAACATAFAAFLPAALFGWSVGLLGLGVVIVATRMPQLVQLVRATHADGVSVASWLYGAASVGLWLAYYVSTTKLAAAATMAAALAMNLSIVAFTLARHRQSNGAVRGVLDAPELVFEPA
jgi:uncharacterized protein with PQ loop repeat